MRCCKPAPARSRRRKLATAVTAELLRLLRAAGNEVALNVKNDNAAAISCYKKLGFELYCEYEESLFTRKKNSKEGK